MNANDNIKSNFIFFQNEVLSDMKKLESKFIEQIFQINNVLEQNNLKIENKINDLNSRFIMLTNQIHEKKNTDSPELIIQPIKQKIEENISKLEIKINMLEKDLDSACFKYDKLITNNFNIPGLIGSSCPYESLRPFLEYVNLKIVDLLKAKERQTFDFKKYKEKLETIINNNKTQFDTTQKKINEFCKNGFKQCDINCTERNNVIEKRIEALRIENGQFAFDLKQRTDELKIEWEKLDNVEKNLNVRYNEELEKYNNLIEGIKKKVEKSKDEFNLIKMRFTELSDFIKDIRFRTNLHNSYQERKQYKEMSYRIDFTKKQKLNNEELQEIQEKEKVNENKDKIDDILAPFDYYAYFGIDHAMPQEEGNYNNNNNNSDNNRNYNENINDNNNENINDNNNENINTNSNENINEINNENINEINNENINEINYENNDFINNEKNDFINNEDNDFINNENKIKEKVKKMNSTKLVRKDSKYKTHNLFNLNNNDNLNMMNLNIEPEIKKNNIIYNNSTIDFHDNKNKIKNTERKLINIKGKNNKKSKNNDNKVANNNINFNPINNEKNNIKENNEKQKKKFLNLKEITKINDVILGAEFNNNFINNNSNNNNLSQAYILMKKKTEEMQRKKSIYGGKQEIKHHQICTPLSSKNNTKYSRNNNYNLNQLNLLSSKEFKKGNIEDLYYSQLKREKFNHISYPPKLLLRSSSIDTINSNKRIFPKILGDN